jgi:hypothetical protein
MAEHRPSLQKYLVKDDDEEFIDHRILGDQLIKNFPWPIGVELRRLFSGTLQRPDRGRLDQIFKTIERTMQFISYVLISQLWEEKRKRELPLPQEFVDQFQRRIETTTLGNFSWVIRIVSRIIRDSGGHHFMTEMDDVLDRKFFQLLDFWAPERNDIGHYQINLTQDEIEKRCVEYEEKLSLILQALSFLSRYKLVTMREIMVRKVKHREAAFHHHIDLLNSSDSDFKATEVAYTSYIDSNSVLLMKDFKEPGEFLNLSPLVIDTRPEVIDQKSKFMLKKDIFLYTRFQNDRLNYIGTEVTEKVDLTMLSFYPDLLDQFRELITTMTQPTDVHSHAR